MSALNLLGTALAPGSALGGRTMPKTTTSTTNDPSSPGIVSHVDVLSASLSNISDIPDHDPLYPRSPTSPQASAALPTTNGGAIWETTVAAADVLDTFNKTTNTIPLDLNKRVSEAEKLRKDIKKKGNALDKHRAKKKAEAKAEEERKQKIREMASERGEEYDNNGMVKPSLSQSLKKYRNMASSTSKVVKVDTNEQSKKSSSKKMEVQIDSSSRKKSAVKGTSSTAKKEVVKVEKNTTKAAAIPTATKSSGDSVHFTSDAANNYYRAMKLGRSPPTATNNDDAAKESMNDYMTFLRDKKSSTTQQQINVITPKQSQPQTVPIAQQPQKKTREQLIAEALHITKTPTEISQYLLAQGDTIEYAEKMELYTEILTKQKELLKKKEKERAKLLNKVDKKNNKKKSMGVVNKLNILKGNTSSNKNKIAAPAVITPPKADPPPTQIHPVTSFDKHTIFSAKSDITDIQYGDTTKSLEGCSVATEQYVSSGLSPKEEEDHDNEPTMKNAFVNDTTKMMNDITKAASPPTAAADYDPPISEYPSPINSPNEDTLGYPEDNVDPVALLDKVGLPTNMLPDRIKIDNGPTIDHLPSSPGCDGIELDLVHSPTAEDEQQEKEETQDVSKSKVRSLSPFLKTASSETTQDTDNKKKPIRSSSPLVKLKKKMTRSSSPSALPPKIPNRPIVPVDPPETRLSLDDDGSVECSGVWDDVETNVNDDDDTEASDSVMIQNLPGADDDQIMLDNSHDEVEDDTDDSSKLMAIATIKRVDTAASSAPKKKKTSRMALAREKMTRLKLKKSNVAVEEKEDEAVLKNATSTAVTDADAEPPKQELPDDHTITSTTSSKERKKEKLKKIMEYRKKASPSVQPNESWASLARSESNLSERKSKKEGEKKTEDEMNRVELLELLKKEREAASSKEGSNDSNKSSSKDKEAREEAGSDTKRGEHEKQPIVREQSTFSADGVKHPVKHISVYPNTSEYDDNDDMTLPPELRKSERVDIWKEAVPSESFDSRVQTPNPKINGVTDAFLTCGEKMLELEDVDTMYDGDTLAADANTVVDKSAKDGESNTVGDQTATKKQRNRFACGIDPEELKQDLVYEAKSIGQDVKTGIKAMGNDVKTGIRNSVRNLFGACDITNTGGVDVLDKNFNEIGDQLLGRVPMPKKRTNSTAKSSVEAPVSPDKNPADETPAVTVNPQAEKITDILSGTDAARKHFDGVYQNQNDAEQEAEVSKELDELMQKKEKPLTVEEKKQLYLQKLKNVSMKHL